MKAVSVDGAQLVYQVATHNFFGGDSIVTPLTAIAYQGVIINLVLAVFNLIPVAPLDGAAVVSGLLPRTLAGTFEAMQSYGMFLLLGLLVLGVPSRLYTPVISYVISFLVA